MNSANHQQLIYSSNCPTKYKNVSKDKGWCLLLSHWLQYNHSNLNSCCFHQMFRCSVISWICRTERQRQKKFFSFSTGHTVVCFFFFFFSLNPVKLFLRADQCSYASVLQLINETALILLLSALFIGLLLLLLISPCLLLTPSSPSPSSFTSSSFS